MRNSFFVDLIHDGDKTYWLAQSKKIKDCIGVGETAEEAIVELGSNEAAWYKTAEEYGIIVLTGGK